MKDLKFYLNKSLSSFVVDENIKFNSVVCFIHSEDEIFFIQRVNEMPTHKGDIAFIGGHKIKGETILETAYREFEEEVSISKEVLSFEGYLDSTFTMKSKNIAVCCFELKISKLEFLKNIKSNGEWSHSFFIHSSSFLSAKRWSYSNFSSGNKTRRVYFYDILGLKKNLWGMSASIVFNLFKNSLTGDKNTL